MSALIRNWAITALCVQTIAFSWFFAFPELNGKWFATRGIAMDQVWAEYEGCEAYP